MKETKYVQSEVDKPIESPIGVYFQIMYVLFSDIESVRSITLSNRSQVEHTNFDLYHLTTLNHHSRVSDKLSSVSSLLNRTRKRLNRDGLPESILMQLQLLK